MDPSSAPPAADAGTSTAEDPRVLESTLRALLLVADDLYVGHEESVLLASTLEHLTGALGAASGVTFLKGEVEELRPRVRHGQIEGDLTTARAIARVTLEEACAQ